VFSLRFAAERGAKLLCVDSSAPQQIMQALMSVDSSDRERPSAMSSAVLWSLVSALTFMAGRPSNAFTICNSMYIDGKILILNPHHNGQVE
ncbi:hypothetical protein Tco_1524950, partial [Tanacetum coccineum]